MKLAQLQNRFSLVLDKYLSNPIGLRNVFYSKKRKNYVSSNLDLEISDLYKEILLYEKICFDSEKDLSVNHKICEIFKLIKKNLQTVEIKRPQNVILEKYKFVNPSFNQIIQASENFFNNYSVTVIPICSIVDGGFVDEWSDVDCMFYLSDSCFEPSKLRRIQEEILRFKASFSYIDPMQDHGLFTLTDIDLMSYSEYRMPISVLRHGYAYPQKIEFSFRCDTLNEELRKKELINFLKNEILVLENLKYNYANFRYLLHRVFLYPSLYFQYHGITLYKPEAISKYRNECKYNLEFMRLACHFYDNFSLKRNYRIFISIKTLRKLNFLMPYLLKQLYSIKNKNLFDNTIFNKIRSGFIQNIKETLLT